MAVVFAVLRGGLPEPKRAMETSFHPTWSQQPPDPPEALSPRGLPAPPDALPELPNTTLGTALWQIHAADVSLHGSGVRSLRSTSFGG